MRHPARRKALLVGAACGVALLGAGVTFRGDLAFHYHAWRLDRAVTLEEARPSLAALEGHIQDPARAQRLVAMLGPRRPRLTFWVYSGIAAVLEAHWEDQESQPFGEALSRLRLIAEAGCVEAAAALAERYALDGPHHQPDEAYRWYFIASSAEGYSTDFHNEQPGPHYLGPVGDFRNESMVSSLVDELGFERVRELDRQAAAWLRDHRLFFTDPRDHRTRAEQARP